MTGTLTGAYIDTIFATVKPANIASIRVLEKSGFAQCEYLPEKDRLLYRIDRPVEGKRDEAPFRV